MTGGTFLAVLFDQMARDTRYYTSHKGGPAAVYRHGCVWITTKDDAQSWVDRTGMPELLQSLSAGPTGLQAQQIRDKLDSFALAYFVDETPAGVARSFREMHKINLRFNNVDQSMLFNMEIDGASLRDALAAMCDLYDLRIRWEGGTTLIVEPQSQLDWPPPYINNPACDTSN
jgi:hypothetical protein